MKADTFLNAVGLIDDRYLDVDIQSNRIVLPKWRKRVVSIAVAAALIVCPLPTLTAFGVESAYHILYRIAPAIAQTFKPVRKTCEDNGIEMTIISAEKTDNRVSCYLALRDVDGKYADALDMDLFGYDLPFDCTGYCNFAEYDTNEDISYFIANMERIDGRPISNGKITFRINRVLYGRERFKDILPDIDLTEVADDPAVIDYVNDPEYSYLAKENPELIHNQLLLPNQEIQTPIAGTKITGIGYIDGALHIQTYYEDYDEIHHDGFFDVWLADQNGEWLKLRQSEWLEIIFMNETHTGQYREMIFHIPYQDLQNYQVIGDIYKTAGGIDGNWEITFPLS